MTYDRTINVIDSNKFVTSRTFIKKNSLYNDFSGPSIYTVAAGFGGPEFDSQQGQIENELLCIGCGLGVLKSATSRPGN